MLPHLQLDGLLESADLLGVLLAGDCEVHEVLLFGLDGAHAGGVGLLLNDVYVAEGVGRYVVDYAVEAGFLEAELHGVMQEELAGRFVLLGVWLLMQVPVELQAEIAPRNVVPICEIDIEYGFVLVGGSSERKHLLSAVIGGLNEIFRVPCPTVHDHEPPIIQIHRKAPTMIQHLLNCIEFRWV